MAGFAYRKNLDGSNVAPAMMVMDADDSVTFQKGDLVRVNQDGDINLVAGGDAIAGVLVAILTANGLPVDTDSGTTDTWTTPASTTYKAQFIPALANYLFYNDADASLTATMMFQYFDVNDENDVDVALASDTTGQVKLIERDPDGDGDASKGLFQIVESMFAQLDNTSGVEA